MKKRHRPDFNLLQTKDPDQLDMIYNALQNNEEKSDNNIYAEFMPNNTSQEVEYIFVNEE